MDLGLNQNYFKIRIPELDIFFILAFLLGKVFAKFYILYLC